MKISFTTREDVETLCDDAAATGNAKLLREIGCALNRAYGLILPKLTADALFSRARGIENRLAGRIQAAQAYEDQSEARIKLLPERLANPFTIEV